MRIRVTNNGQAAYMTKVTNADTGEQITNAFRLELDVHKVPIAILHTHLPVVDWEGEVEVYAHCPMCKRVQEVLDPATALLAFMGWLTPRDAVAGPFSSHHEAADAVELVKAFCEAQGWKVDDARYDETIKALKKKYPEEGDQYGSR